MLVQEIPVKKLVVFLGIFFLVQISGAENVYQELEDLTEAQRGLLASFKRSVLPILPHEYMKEDIYLVKFMKFNDFVVGKARHHLKQMLKWRENSHVDEVLKNPPAYFAEVQKEYPVFVDGYDKEDRPICEIPFGSWSVRKAAEEGLIKKLVSHLLINCFERAAVKIREQQAAGKNVTQWVLLADMSGFNITEHVCSACMPLALHVATGTDRYYPLSNYGIWLLNTAPESFTKLWRMMRPAMSPATRETMKIFPAVEQEWKPFLEQHVDLKEISNWYGGAKERNTR